MIAYVLLTGQPPFDHPHPVELMQLHLKAEPPRLAKLRPDLPPALDNLVARMMAKAPEERPESIEVVATEFGRSNRLPIRAAASEPQP